MISTQKPLVSIGLPVYNGENYLEEAIYSVLAQSFTDFELLIFDNASTDRTPAICKQFVMNDARVLYFRNKENIGAAANHNRCVEHARGTYFKWLSHDDVIAPTFLEAAVAALEATPAAVLCCSGARRIDANGLPLHQIETGRFDTRGLSQRERFRAELLLGKDPFDIFGLFRRQALVGTQLHGVFRGQDRALLVEMALRGPFVKLDDVLLVRREHPERFVNTAWKDARAYNAWLDPLNKRPDRFQHWVFPVRILGLIHRYVRHPRDRLRCYAYWLRATGNRRRLKKMLQDALLASRPGGLRRNSPETLRARAR